MNEWQAKWQGAPDSLELARGVAALLRFPMLEYEKKNVILSARFSRHSLLRYFVLRCKKLCAPFPNHN